MSIVKWLVTPYASAPERKEYDKETDCFYIWRSGRMKTARRDAKSSTYYRYFDSESEALEFIRKRAENKADQKRVDQINRCGVELLAALESLVLFTNPKPSNAAALDRAHQVIAKARGEA
jgi:hypothetical protein